MMIPINRRVTGVPRGPTVHRKALIVVQKNKYAQSATPLTFHPHFDTTADTHRAHSPTTKNTLGRRGRLKKKRHLDPPRSMHNNFRRQSLPRHYDSITFATPHCHQSRPFSQTWQDAPALYYSAPWYAQNNNKVKGATRVLLL